MKKRRWQMLDDYATLQMKPFLRGKRYITTLQIVLIFYQIYGQKRPIKKHILEKINRLTRSKRTIWEA